MWECAFLIYQRLSYTFSTTIILNKYMDPTNKKVIGKFKDEVAGMPIKLTKDDCSAKKQKNLSFVLITMVALHWVLYMTKIEPLRFC